MTILHFVIEECLLLGGLKISVEGRVTLYMGSSKIDEANSFNSHASNIMLMLMFTGGSINGCEYIFVGSVDVHIC